MEKQKQKTTVKKKTTVWKTGTKTEIQFDGIGQKAQR